MMDDWRSEPYRRAGSALSFPRDAGWHRLFGEGEGLRLSDPSMLQMEWVYLNAHVDEEGGEGRRFVVFAAYFTQWLRFLVVRAWDREDRYLGVWTGTAIGSLHATEGRHHIEFKHPGGVDTWIAQGRPFDSVLRAHDDAGRFSLDLTLHNTRTPYEAGGTGYLPFAKKGWFYYYSLTRLEVGGALDLTHADGRRETVKVAGRGWFDHQWGDFQVTPFRLPNSEEYEWTSVQLDSGEDLMLTTVWEPHGETPSLDAYGGVGIIRPDDKWNKVIGPRSVTRTRFWRSIEQDAVYSAGWHVEVPEWKLSLDLVPRHADQLTPIIDATAPGLAQRALKGVLGPVTNWLGSFWEGSCRVTGTIDGRAVTGVAFAELIKRYPQPRFTLEIARQEPGLTVIEWRVKGWDAQAPLLYCVTIETTGGHVLCVQPDLDVSVAVIEAATLPRGVELVARVVAASGDGVLRGEATRVIVLR